MDCVAKFFTTYKDALVVVTWIIGVIGWGIANYQSNTREKRKEVRSEVDSITSEVTKIVLLARTYYGDEPTNDQDDMRSTEIAFDVTRAIARVERLANRFPEFKDAKSACDEFLTSVTGEHFQSKSRLVFGPSSDELRKIELSVHSLIGSLEDGFAKVFWGEKK